MGEAQIRACQNYEIMALYFSPMYGKQDGIASHLGAHLELTRNGLGISKSGTIALIE